MIEFNTVNESNNEILIRKAGYKVLRPTVFGCTILEVSKNCFYIVPAGIQFKGIEKKREGRFVLNLAYRTRKGMDKKRITIPSISAFHLAYTGMLDEILKLSEDGRDRPSQLPFRRSTLKDGDKVYLLDIKAYKEVYSKREDILKKVADSLGEDYLIINSRQILADVVLDNMQRLNVGANEFSKLVGITEDCIREFTRGRYQSIDTIKSILDFKGLECDYIQTIKAVVESKPHPRVTEFEEEFCKEIPHNVRTYVIKKDDETLFLTNDTVRLNLAFLFRRMRHSASVDGAELRKEVGIKKYSLQLLESGDGAHTGSYINNIVDYIRISVSKRDVRIRLTVKHYVDEYVAFRKQYLEQRAND